MSVDLQKPLWKKIQETQMEGCTRDPYIKCPTCKGTGFFRVDYALVKEEVHARCDDCEGKGKLKNEIDEVEEKI